MNLPESRPGSTYLQPREIWHGDAGEPFPLPQLMHHGGRQEYFLIELGQEV
jgi:hypothetical protein